MSREYTPENPLVIYADHADYAERRRTEIAELFANFGGVKVWHNLEIGGRQTIWITAPPNETLPNWRSGDPVIITDKDCIVIKEPLGPPKFVTRTYMDLELFKLSAELAGIKCAMGVWYVARHLRTQVNADWNGEFDEVDFESFATYLAELADDDFDVTGTAVILHHERTACDGQGGWAGIEEYEVQLQVVARSDSDDLFIPPDLRTPLVSWLVRIDEHAMNNDLVSWPQEVEATEAWTHPDVPEVKYEEPEDIEEDDRWVAGFMIEGDFISAADYEDYSWYAKPDDQFVWEECTALLRRILSIGLRREFMREESEKARGLDEKAAPVWRVVNKYGEGL